MKGAVYDPPANGLPHLAVVLNKDNEVVVADAVVSRDAGTALIARVFQEFAEAKNRGDI